MYDAMVRTMVDLPDDLHRAVGRLHATPVDRLDLAAEIDSGSGVRTAGTIGAGEP
jgi:hypothetical protein